MPNIKTTILRFAIVAAISAGVAGDVNAQSVPGTGGHAFVWKQPLNPFTAEYVIKSDSTASDGHPTSKTFEVLVARDTQGRVRFQWRTWILPKDDKDSETLDTREGESFTVTSEERGTIVLVFDCVSAKRIQIQPELRIAKVDEDEKARCAQAADQVFCDPAFQLLRSSRVSSRLKIEDLGYREIGGVQVRGLKLQTRGAADDVDWNEKVVSEEEVWSSEELAVTISRNFKDFKNGAESRFELKNIKRQEPNPAIFEIPDGYKINLNPSKDLPYLSPRSPTSGDSRHQPQ